jgi:hypothetical protein
VVLSGRVTVSTTYSQYNFPRFQNLKCQKSEHNTARVLSRPHSPVPQIVYWRQTERLRWSRNTVCLRGAFAQNPYIVSGTSHQLDRDRADAGRFWQIADRCTVLGGELSYPPYSGRRFASSLRRRAVAGP